MKNKFSLVVVVILFFSLFSKAQNPIAKCDSLPFIAYNVPLGDSLTSQTFTLKNAGGDTLTVSDTTSLNSSPWWRSNVKPATIHLANGETKTFTFSFVPTVVGPKQLNYVITTNGGTITIHLVGNSVDCSVINIYPYTESFESMVFPPACWTTANPDGGTGWNKISNNTSPLPGWADGTITMPQGGGTNAAYCTRNTGGATYNNQYLISRQFTNLANLLVFDIFWYEHYQDYIDVKISTTTNDVASFTNTIFTIDTSDLIYGVWKQFIIPTLYYGGQNIYFAFVEHVPNNTTQGAFIGIDMFITEFHPGIEENPNQIISVFPNPANDKIFITAENIKSVEVFNILGESIGSYGHVKEINCSNLSTGFYFVKVITDGKTVTRKINIAR